MTLDEACLAIMYFIDRFSFSNVAKQKLIELIKFLIPINNNLPSTVNKISKIVSLLKFNPITDRYCKSSSVKIDAELNKCTNENCPENNKVSRSFNTFKYFDIEQPIKELIKRFNHKIIDC